MDSDPSQGTRASEPAPTDSIRNAIAFFVRYLELRLQLFGLESRETGLHLLVLALLLVSTIIFFVGFVAMLIVFLLYLMMLTLHWEWGWSALALAGLLLLTIVIAIERLVWRMVRKMFAIGGSQALDVRHRTDWLDG